MIYEVFETVELGQAEALIEICWPGVEEMQDKYDPRVPTYVEFEGPGDK